ncbi:gas vesicle protein GvpG [Streptomyces sp. NPDC014864]|uniref:gas vesicle protein GvpG n=1 Tax=Streptomyces sp. NPDC014864 TaxID=3364924 RepID=UPI0036F623AA
MGIVSELLLLPLAPVRGTVWVADRLLEEAERQMRDPRAVQARLAALNRALDDGAIDEETFEKEEERLLGLLGSPTRPLVAPAAGYVPVAPRRVRGAAGRAPGRRR